MDFNDIYIPIHNIIYRIDVKDYNLIQFLHLTDLILPSKSGDGNFIQFLISLHFDFRFYGKLKETVFAKFRFFFICIYILSILCAHEFVISQDFI